MLNLLNSLLLRENFININIFTRGMKGFEGFGELESKLYPDNYVRRIKDDVCSHIKFPSIVETPKKTIINKYGKIKTIKPVKLNWVLNSKMNKKQTAFEVRANFNIENKINTTLEHAIRREGYSVLKKEYHCQRQQDYSLIIKKEDKQAEVTVIAKERPRHYEISFYKK